MYWLPDAEAVPPRVGYAVGRAVGPAVVRNRVRRRVRALLASRAAAGAVPGGWYLLGARPAAAGRTSAGLAADLDGLLARAAAKVDR